MKVLRKVNVIIGVVAVIGAAGHFWGIVDFSMNLVTFYLGMLYMFHGIEMAKRVENGKTLAYVYLLAAVICFSGLIVQNIF